jgi:formylglycine-generating enzyme
MSWATTNSLHWLLPSENEWYKAAYYNAATGDYYAYPFQSNSQPAPLAPPGNTNSGNFNDVVYKSNGNGIYLTDVGAYPRSLAPFGSFDMGGGVFQWNDTAIGSSRGLRGGFWGDNPSDSAASFRIDDDPTFEFFGVGFRVASVPEPGSIILVLIGLLGLVIFNKGFRAIL